MDFETIRPFAVALLGVVTLWFLRRNHKAKLVVANAAVFEKLIAEDLEFSKHISRYKAQREIGVSKTAPYEIGNLNVTFKLQNELKWMPNVDLEKLLQNKYVNFKRIRRLSGFENFHFGYAVAFFRDDLHIAVDLEAFHQVSPPKKTKYYDYNRLIMIETEIPIDSPYRQDGVKVDRTYTKYEHLKKDGTPDLRYADNLTTYYCYKLYTLSLTDGKEVILILHFANSESRAKYCEFFTLAGVTGHRPKNAKSKTEKVASPEEDIPSREANSPFLVLGIPDDASTEIVKDTYRKLVMKYHPDKFAGVDLEFQKLAGDKFRRIQAAYEEVLASRGGDQ